MTENGIPVSVKRFATYPYEWQIQFDVSDHSSIKLSDINNVSDKVKQLGGEFLVHITYHKEVRNELYRLGFEDYFQDIVSELTLSSLKIPNIALPKKYNIHHSEHRGFGIATSIKAKMIRYLKDKGFEK